MTPPSPGRADRYKGGKDEFDIALTSPRAHRNTLGLHLIRVSSLFAGDRGSLPVTVL